MAEQQLESGIFGVFVLQGLGPLDQSRRRLIDLTAQVQREHLHVDIEFIALKKARQCIERLGIFRQPSQGHGLGAQGLEIVGVLFQERLGRSQRLGVVSDALIECQQLVPSGFVARVGIEQTAQDADCAKNVLASGHFDVQPRSCQRVQYLRAVRTWICKAPL